MALICPRCNCDLVARNVYGIELDFCENGCQGIWFDVGEYKKIRDLEKIAKKLNESQ
ncbi:MAG: zf-TFIIB domain-containing protein [Cyanobacteriota bacterium]